MYFTNYVYFTGAAHRVTSTISRDFREITRLSASRFSFPYSDTSIFSRFDFIFAPLAEKGDGKRELRDRAAVLYTSAYLLLYESDPAMNSLWSSPAIPSDRQQWELKRDANKVIITKSDRLAGRHKKPLLEVALLIYSQELYADRFNYKGMKTPSSELRESLWRRKDFFIRLRYTPPALIRRVNSKLFQNSEIEIVPFSVQQQQNCDIKLHIIIKTESPICPVLSTEPYNTDANVLWSLMCTFGIHADYAERFNRKSSRVLYEVNILSVSQI